ncbi:MAG: hypothetical protein FD145_430 [Candidatus Saganbacteria bacterium]|uniref:IPT/TIG domain-containing protein n=1 Tax=Candidatus Saganbacteria bacterium TaxID=2575572 RepID=A0A833P088_UNCSA|nr:MAG: hypothetical protein FD145_430 [Candidatus Saganbacteria bacterium]
MRGYNIYNRIKWLVLVITGVLMLSVSAQAAYFSINAGAENNQVGVGGGKVYNQNGVVAGNELAVGCIIQYIYAGPNGTIDPPNQDGTVGGDDILLATKTVGNDTVWTSFSNKTGMFYHGVTGTYSSGTPKIYVRAWNASTLNAATHYGNSALMDPATLAANPPLPNDIGIANFAATITKPVPAATITSATPGSANSGSVISNIALVGSNTHFTAGSTVSFGTGITVGSVTFADATHITANNVSVTTAATAGLKAVTVTTGAEIASGNVFTVNPAPTSSISPAAGDQGWTNVTATITGTRTHFINGTTSVAFSGAGITVNSTTVNSPTSVVVNLNIAANAAAGARTVTISTNLGALGTETLTTAFTVNSTTPTISRTPTSLTFTAQAGGANPASQTIAISNSGLGNLNWTVSKTQTWLTISPASGTNSGNVTASINLAGLAAGTYNDTITIAATGASNTPQTVPVTLTIQPKPTTISVAPSSANQGWKDTLLTVTGTNTHFVQGTTAVAFSGTGITVKSTTVNSATEIKVTADFASNATPGARTLTVTTGAEITTTPFTVIAETPTLSATPATLTFAAQEGGASPAAKQISVSNAGAGTLNWTADKKQAWLTISPTSGTDAGTITVTANTSAMTAANSPYSDTITITSAGANGSPIAIPVTITISKTPVPVLKSATPASGKQGEKVTSVAIVGENTNFSALSTIDFGAGIKAGTVTFVDKSNISVSNVEIDAAAAAGPRDVKVTTGAEIASGQIFTVTTVAAPPQAGTIVIDDFEGIAVKSTDYYTFGPSDPAKPTAARITTDKHEGSYAMKTSYTLAAKPEDGWRGWGGILASQKDISGLDILSIWLKGDGSAGKVKVQFKDADGTNYAMVDADAITLASTNWTEYKVPNFKTKMTRITTDGDATMDWTKVAQYQLVFVGAEKSDGVLADYIVVTSVATSGPTSLPHITEVSPAKGGEKTTITIKGSNFKADGGTVRFTGGGVMTEVKSSGVNTLITNWTDSQIVMTIPNMTSGQKTLNLVRTDNVASDNDITFEVTNVATTAANTTYNYPNPFNPLQNQVTKIVFNPGTSARVAVYVFDMSAQQVVRLECALAQTEVTWDGKNTYGEIVGDGAYLYRVIDADSNKLINKGKILVINK